MAAVRRIGRPATTRRELQLALTLVVILAGVYFALHPIANVHQAMRGSDDDDAYDIGVRALLEGRNPYLERTYLGNVLHQLPGAFMVAAPFVLIDTSALQNIFWIPLFFVAVRHDSGDGRWAPLALLMLFSSPVVLYHVVTGTGHIANTIYVLLALWWLTRSDASHLPARSVMWGIALSSRANFLFLIPLGFGWLRRRHGWKTAAYLTAITCVTIVTITLPFYLMNSSSFGPLDAADRLSRFNAVLPHADAVIVSAMAALTVVLSVRALDFRSLYFSCAAVQAVPVIVGEFLVIVSVGHLDVIYLEYATFSVWFVIIGLAQPCRTAYPSAEA